MKTLSTTLMILSIALGLGACHPDDAQMNGLDAGTPEGPAAFLGTWHYEAGTSKTSFVCEDGSSFDLSADGTESETFTGGSRANEIVATGGNGCAITCSVSGQTATCFGGEACDGATITTDVYTLLGDKLHEVASGSVVLDDGTSCEFFSPVGVLARAK